MHAWCIPSYLQSSARFTLPLNPELLCTQYKTYILSSLYRSGNFYINIKFFDEFDQELNNLDAPKDNPYLIKYSSFKHTNFDTIIIYKFARQPTSRF